MSGRHSVKQLRGVTYGTQGRNRLKAASVKMQRSSRISSVRSRGPVVRSRGPSETGFVDLAVATYVCDVSGSITLLATIAQGASINQRIGKKCRLVSIQSHGNFVAGTTGTVSDACALIVYDKKPREALPAITDILVTANSRSFNNDAGSDRFVVLRRYDYEAIGNSTTPATGLEAITFDHFVPLRDLPVQFAAAGTGAIGDIEEGALYLVTVGSTVAGTTSANLQAAFRVRFKE